MFNDYTYSNLLDDFLFTTISYALYESINFAYEILNEHFIISDFNKHFNKKCNNDINTKNINNPIILTKDTVFFKYNNNSYVIIDGKAKKCLKRSNVLNNFIKDDWDINKDFIITENNNINNSYYLEDFLIKSNKESSLYTVRPSFNSNFNWLDKSYIYNYYINNFSLFSKVFFKKSKVLKNNDNIFLYGKVINNNSIINHEKEIKNYWVISEPYFKSDSLNNNDDYLNVECLELFKKNSMDNNSYFSNLYNSNNNDQFLQNTQYILDFLYNKSLIKSIGCLISCVTLGLIFYYKLSIRFRKYLCYIDNKHYKQRTKIFCIKCKLNENNVICNYCNNIINVCYKCLENNALSIKDNKNVYKCNYCKIEQDAFCCINRFN